MRRRSADAADPRARANTGRLAVGIALLALSLLPCSAGTSPRTVTVSNLRFYAWYWDGGRDQVTYHELTGFPVEDDLEEYPDFDVVGTVTNPLNDSAGPFTLETTVSYQIGPYTRSENREMDALAMRHATWGKPVWTKRTHLERIDARSFRPVRLAVIPTIATIDGYWKRRQYVYRARFTVVLKEGQGKQTRVLSRLQRELAIDMLD